MLAELSSFENLGTPNYFFQLLRKLQENPNTRWTKRDISGLFYNKLVDNRIVFDGCVPLLLFLGVLRINENFELTLIRGFDDSLSTERKLHDELVKQLLTKVSSDTVFYQIFCTEQISYDHIYKSIQIDNSAFPLKYSNFKQLLLDFGVLIPHPIKDSFKYIINSRYKLLFDRLIISEIKKRKVGLEQLKKSQEQNSVFGEEAERFVVRFEMTRLNESKEIEWVAQYSVAEGYDIASYENEESASHDRFIEVKSFINTPYFFWSRNEIDTSRLKKEKYFLYLVDRSKMNFPGYTPIIIRNPYTNVYQNKFEWEQRIELIRLQRLSMDDEF